LYRVLCAGLAVFLCMVTGVCIGCFVVIGVGFSASIWVHGLCSCT